MKNTVFNFWTKEIDSRPLALCRIISGITCLLMFLSYIPNLERYFFYTGIHHTPLSKGVSIGYLLNLLDLQQFDFFQNWLVIALLILGVISAITFIIGYKTKVSNIILLIAFMSFANFSLLVRNAEDGLLALLLFIMLFTNAGSSFSLDNKLNKKSQANTTNPYGIRLLQISIFMLYIFIAIDKFTESEWRTGEALYWILAVTPYNDFAHWEIFRHEILTKLMTWSAMGIELIAPIGLLFRKTRPIAFLALFCLHCGIIFMMGRFVMVFNLATLAGLSLFFPFFFFFHSLNNHLTNQRS